MTAPTHYKPVKNVVNKQRNCVYINICAECDNLENGAQRATFSVRLVCAVLRATHHHTRAEQMYARDRT